MSESKKSSSVEYEERIKHVSTISQPLASKKLTKRVYKNVKKTSKANKKVIRRGVKEVVKAIRKKEKGVCIIAGDISPIDVIAHLPVLCEDNNIPYVFTPSKADLGASALSKRPTSCLLITTNSKASKENDSASELVQELVDQAKAVQKVY